VANLNALCCLFVATCPNFRAWLYPDSSTLREYQFKAAWRLISSNSLVCFPTGTGKTLIAAVVMFNYYRWFPKVGRRVTV
jgi:ERCC4-related helicase